MKGHFSSRGAVGFGLGLALALVLLPAAAAGQATPQKPSDARVTEAMNRVEPAAPEATTAVRRDADEYVIGADDVLAIDVWREPEVSRVEPVRPDGKITLPLVGEIQASGETTKSLQSAIAKKLANYIHQPAVTVIVQQARSHRFNIIGEVARPGSYALGSRMTVLDAIAVAGGFREFAKVTRIYVVRRRADGSSVRLRFNYKDAVRGDRQSLDRQLESGDTIIVP
jgi:polysaccharide export outer membrane protein